jgi:hypothetical protein
LLEESIDLFVLLLLFRLLPAHRTQRAPHYDDNLYICLFFFLLLSIRLLSVSLSSSSSTRV